ncbi:MAG TPA: protein kinase [Gemmatimonadaceae bacterium]
MTTPTDRTRENGSAPPMTPERWRAVDAILQTALACEPERREAVIAVACGADVALRREVESLLAAHVDEADDFLERPAAEVLGVPETPPLAARLAKALEGRYVIEREIARGGMATVHLARDLRHGRRVAIKVLREEIAAAIGAERFLEEIRVTASLQHPHILPLFDSGGTDGVLWYAMPFVEGETLRARLAREGPLPVAEALRLSREIADALDHAHARGVVHRDIKPENVLLQHGHALVADFGIALALEQAGVDRVTRTGVAIGTPQYMAPEQAAGERALDARVDVYALGAVLHEMLAGESPFAAATRRAAVRRLMYEPPGALATRRPDVAPFVDAALRRALAAQPEDRFPSAAEFAAALAAHGGELEGTGAGGRARGRTVPARAAFYAAVAMLGVGLAAGLLLNLRPLFERRADPVPIVKLPGDFVRQGAVLGTGGGDGDLSLTVFDRSGQQLQSIQAERPWTPRFSPDGHLVVYGAFGKGRSTSDLWVTDLDAGVTKRLTNDDVDANDPQWSADGRSIAYSASAPGGKDVELIPLKGGNPRELAVRDGNQFPSDWLRDGSALLLTEEAGSNGYDILVQPADGSAARPYVATSASETAARISPDGRWVAYTSNSSGNAEVYLDSYPQPRRRVLISSGGGEHPVWRGDGRELYYWHDGRLIAVEIGEAKGDVPPAIGAHTLLFKAHYPGGINQMYDVSPDGKRFVIAGNR